tara:strand:- start:1674 stop:2012 length:339 start_codon:yes stop_codon:yes gene_type:complete
MGFFDSVKDFFEDDVGGFFKQIPKRVVGGAIGAGVGSGLVDPNSLAKGSMNVPKTKKYLLHKGEMVVPKKEATKIRRKLAEKKKKAPPRKPPVRTLPVKKAPKGKGKGKGKK